MRLFPPVSANCDINRLTAPPHIETIPLSVDTSGFGGRALLRQFPGCHLASGVFFCTCYPLDASLLAISAKQSAAKSDKPRPSAMDRSTRRFVVDRLAMGFPEVAPNGTIPGV